MVCVLYWEPKFKYISPAVIHFYGTEWDIWAGFGRVGNAENFGLGLKGCYFWQQFVYVFMDIFFLNNVFNLESRIEEGQGINLGHGNFAQNNKHRALIKHRAWNKFWKPKKLENVIVWVPNITKRVLQKKKSFSGTLFKNESIYIIKFIFLLIYGAFIRKLHR